MPPPPAPTITASNGPVQLDVIVVGHCACSVPALLEGQATALASGSVEGPLCCATEAGHFLLLKPKGSDWLEGGERWRLLGADIVTTMRAQGLVTARVHVAGTQAEVQALAEGLALADYRFLDCRSGKAARRRPLTIRLPGHSAAVRAAQPVAAAQNIARHLVDSPPNHLHPSAFLAAARRVLRGSGVRVSAVTGLAALTKAGCPGLVQVGQGSAREPVLIELSWRPPLRSRRKTAKGASSPRPPHLALVGKGITFDSGGVSIKPAQGMWEMKADMAGAAAVLAAMRLIAARRTPLPVTAWIGLAENLLDGRAGRPGDIYRARNGRWIHVDNTDAEGRLVLADLLSLAGERGATHIVDVATLTGACLVALGRSIAGVMGNDAAFVDTLREAAATVGETLWQLPLYGEYEQLLEHPHADLNNSGGRYAGTITAGLFLKHFVDPTRVWAHLDIAGPAMRSDGWRYYAKGNTGFGVRSLAALALRLAGSGQ